MLNPTNHPAKSGKARVLIVDDQPVVRERLAQLIHGDPNLALCGDADTARAAFELADAYKPDLVVTGLSLKGSHGLDFIKDLHQRSPAVRVLVFSMYDESLYAERAIRAGASGFLGKREPTEQVLHAIRRILAGAIHLSDRVTSDTVQRFFATSSRSMESELTQLSDRELEVFESIGRGRTGRQIAAALCIDLKTIETYRSRIKLKLKVNSGSELAEYARRWIEQMVSGEVGEQGTFEVLGPRTASKRRLGRRHIGKQKARPL
jgi:DNA-binding NarL/FixJ family response regulator